MSTTLLTSEACLGVPVLCSCEKKGAGDDDDDDDDDDGD